MEGEKADTFEIDFLSKPGLQGKASSSNLEPIPDVTRTRSLPPLRGWVALTKHGGVVL